MQLEMSLYEHFQMVICNELDSNTSKTHSIIPFTCTLLALSLFLQSFDVGIFAEMERNGMEHSQLKNANICVWTYIDIWNLWILIVFSGVNIITLMAYNHPHTHIFVEVLEIPTDEVVSVSHTAHTSIHVCMKMANLFTYFYVCVTNRFAWCYHSYAALIKMYCRHEMKKKEKTLPPVTFYFSQEFQVLGLKFALRNSSSRIK